MTAVSETKRKKPTLTEVTPAAGEVVVAYKGFNKDWTCRGFQYAIGQTYTHDGGVVRCTSGGFHSCEMPLDVWNYYAPASSTFALVETGGKVDRVEGGDTKIASGSITIKGELRLPDIIRRAVDWILSAAKGKSGVTTGDYAHAVSTGYYANAVSAGYGAHAVSTGNYANAVSTGDCAHAASAGDFAHAASTGNYAHAASAGDYAHAASAGYCANVASTGNYANAVSAGYGAHAVSTGNYANAVSTGDCAHAASTGKSSVAASIGICGRAKAGIGGAITLCNYDNSNNLRHIRSSKVGENGIKPDTWYALNDAGEFEEVQP